MTEEEALIVAEVVAELSYYCPRETMLEAVARLNGAAFKEGKDERTFLWTSPPTGQRVRVASC